MSFRTIIFLGPQGSGKGTQVAELKTYLEAHTDFHPLHFNAGQALRNAKAEDSLTARRIAELIDNGILVPGGVIAGLFFDFTRRFLTTKSLLLIDGYPRTEAQFEYFVEMLGFYGVERVDVIALDIPESLSVERITARGREDDTEEVIKQRLALYHSETLPLIEEMRSDARFNVHTIDATRDIAEIQADIQAKLEL